MTRRLSVPEEDCPVALASAAIGDRWTLLVLRELFFGAHRFDQLVEGTGATPQMLSSRLKALEAGAIVERVAYSERPLRYDYRLTGRGRDLFPILYALRNWGERHCRIDAPDLAIHYTHRACGTDVGLESVCPGCGEALAYGSIKGVASDGRELKRSLSA